MSSKKAQVSTEFLFAIGIVIIIFILLLFLSYTKTKEVKDTERYLQKKAECIKIADIASGVYALGPGTQKTSRTEFQVHLKNNTIVEVQRKGHTIEEPPVQCRFSASAQEKNFTGMFTITNSNNTLVVS